MEERRKFLRFNVPLRVELSLEGTFTFFSRGEALDFSREGLKIVIPSAKILKDNPVELKVYLPNRPAPVSFKASVVWIKDKDDGSELGIKITDISSKEKSELLEYVYNVWKENMKESDESGI